MAHLTPTIIRIAKMSSQAKCAGIYFLNPILVCPATLSPASPSLLYPYSIIHKQSKNCNPQTDLTSVFSCHLVGLGWNSGQQAPSAISLTLISSVHKHAPAFDLHQKLHASKRCCCPVYPECTVIWCTENFYWYLQELLILCTLQFD